MVLNQVFGWVLLGGLIGMLLIGFIAFFLLQRQRYQAEMQCSRLEQQLQDIQQNHTALRTAEAELQRQLQQNEYTLRQLSVQNATNEEKLQQQTVWYNEYQRLEQEVRHLMAVNSAQDAELREINARFEESRNAMEEKQRVLVESEQRLALQFENLASRIFEQSGQRVNQQNKQSLDLLLTPLREQLDGFKRQVQEGFSQEARDRHTLTYEIRQLQTLNAKMSQETLNLTQALKGDNKIQGNWGEVVLTKVLQSSGLREGHEYETQVSIAVEQLEQGNRAQPDVIVRLPHNKDVIIDAKMSLVAYERYFNDDDEQRREQWLKEHIHSIRQHIKLLGQKDYQRLPGLRSLDYVLLFIPIEPAFLTAIDREPNLIDEASRRNIMLVSPTTLLVALRTINNLWRYEQQNQHAQHIAERAGKLYDKLRLFIENMQNLGLNLKRAQESYQQAMHKLAQDRSNIVYQAEQFRTLGVSIKKPISEEVAAQAGVLTEHDAEI